MLETIQHNYWDRAPRDTNRVEHVCSSTKSGGQKHSHHGALQSLYEKDKHFHNAKH